MNELKRRNVFKMAIAYVVASWLILQITDVLTSVLTLPDTAGKFVFLLVVIGFIPTLVFSWAYEVTPEGIKKESEVDRDESMTRETAARLNRITIGLLVAVTGLVVADRFLLEGATEATQNVSAETSGEISDTPPAPVSVPAEITDTTPSVAVLPFVNMSSDEENEYFSDGISEELLNLLVRIEGLRVPSRTSSFAFKGQNMDIRDIARQLEVNHILEGSVRKSGNTVRVTAQLIDVSTDTHMWSDTYDRELEDIYLRHPG
jgi:TolB-like protein